MRHLSHSTTSQIIYPNRIASMDIITLNCVIYGDANGQAFQVKVDKNESIAFLKKAILEGNRNHFQGIDDDDDLNIWIVSIPGNQKARIMQPNVNIQNDFGGIKADNLDDIVDLIPNPQKKYIHVIVVAPASLLKRSHSDLYDFPSKKLMHRLHFGFGAEVYQDLHFFIAPREADSILQSLMDGQFCLLEGRRQSGKSTTSYFICQQLLKRSSLKNHEVYIFSLKNVVFTGINEFWRSVCNALYGIYGARFEFNKDSVVGPSTFLGFFSNHKWRNPVTLILDEVSVLDGKDQTITQSFVATMRSLQCRINYCVHSYAFVGTEVTSKIIQQPGSQLVPERVLISNNFTISEIESLLSQFAEYQGFNIEVHEIAEEIFDLTYGYKGLVGTYCSIIETEIFTNGKEQLSLKDWQKYGGTELLTFAERQRSSLYKKFSAYICEGYAH